jgi:hypothetical protein
MMSGLSSPCIHHALVADAAIAQARRNIQNADQRGAINVETVRMLEGTLVANISVRDACEACTSYQEDLDS